MNPLSYEKGCANAAQRAGEDLIGTAGHYQTYVLIECPLPWPAKAFDSQHIPPGLRQYIKAVKAARSVQFLCINRGIATLPSPMTVLVYEQADLSARPLAAEAFSADSFVNGYRGQEFQLDGLDQVVPCLEAHWQGNRPGQPIEQQDLLICTHGMRDKCCAQFGQPLFRGAKHLANQGQLPARVWRASHIGGHRFAPTAISLPDGRYYGRLTLSALQTILLCRSAKSGDRSAFVSQLHSVYRGWSILPPPLQVLERQLLLSQGCSWLDNKVSYQLCATESESSFVYAELSVQQADGAIATYRAKFTRDTEQCAKASCGDAVPSPLVRYTVAECSAVRHLHSTTGSTL